MGKQQFAIASLSLIIFVTFANLVAVQSVCPAITTKVTDLDFSKFQGVWNEYSKLPTGFEANSNCNSLQLYGHASGFTAVIRPKTRNIGTEIRGDGHMTSHGQLSINFHAPGGDVVLNLWVLATDYTNFATLYSCSDKGEYAYILIRSTYPDTRSTQPAMNGLIKNGLQSKADILDDRHC